VIQDQVENHVSPYHPWVDESPTPTWFHGTVARHSNETWQLWTLPDPNASASLRGAVLNGWFVNLLPDMNQDDPEVARYEIQNTLWWLGTAGFDGVRQDTWPYVPRKFWRDWMSAIKTQYPNVNVVGEVLDADPSLVSFFQGGKTQYDGVDDLVDSVFDFPLYYKIREAFGQGKPLTVLPDLLSHDYLYPHPQRLVTLIGLHDVARFMNEPKASVDTLKLAFTCLLTTRGIPMIYYGDEIGMAGANDPDNRRDFPGGWKEDANNAFVENGRSASQRQILNHVRKLTRLRQKLECLRNGSTLNLVSTDSVWAYARVTKKQMAVVVIIAGDGPGQAGITLSDLGIPSLAKWTPQLEQAQAPTISNGVAHAIMAPRTAEIYLVDKSF
jgi:neopullulanase